MEKDQYLPPNRFNTIPLKFPHSSNFCFAIYANNFCRIYPTDGCRIMDEQITKKQING